MSLDVFVRNRGYEHVIAHSSAVLSQILFDVPKSFSRRQRICLGCVLGNMENREMGINCFSGHEGRIFFAPKKLASNSCIAYERAALCLFWLRLA
jgi:hypothetical protein